MQKLKNNEARPKFTGSYTKRACIPNEFYLVEKFLQQTICYFFLNMKTKCIHNEIFDYFVRRI